MNLLRAILRLSLASLIAFAPVVVRAQTNTSSPSSAEPLKEGHRYLLVFDTSRSMKPRVSPALDLAEHLIVSGMDGRMHRGDTLGVWTFSSDLRAGTFPLQVWSPERRRAISIAVVSFLEATKIANSTDMRVPVKAALELVKESDAITIVFITGGGGQFKGTPFDTEINAAIRKEARPMRTALLPFAVFLTGSGGKLIDYAVNSPFQPLAYPKTETAEASEPKPAEKAANTAKIVMPPLAETNSAPAAVKTETPPAVEPKPVETAATTQLDATPKTAAAPPVVVVPEAPLRTNEKGSVVLPQPVITTEAPTTRVVREEKPENPKPVDTATEAKPAEKPTEIASVPVQSEATLAAQPTPTVTTTATTEPAAQPQPKAETPAAITPPAEPAIPAETSTTKPVAMSSEPSPKPVVETPAPAVTGQPSTSNSPTPASDVVLAATTTSTEPAAPPTASTPIASPTVVVRAETNAVMAQVTPDSKPVETMSASAQASVTTPTNKSAPAPLIAAIPPEAGYSPRALLIAAFTLLGIAVALVLLLLRRRTPASVSLITRSMNRDKH